MKFSKRIITYK